MGKGKKISVQDLGWAAGHALPRGSRCAQDQSGSVVSVLLQQMQVVRMGPGTALGVLSALQADEVGPFLHTRRVLAVRKRSGDEEGDVVGMRSTYLGVNMKALLI